MRHETVLTFKYDSASHAATIKESLEPEVGDIEGDRTGATLSREGCDIEVRIGAADLVALRAGQNTWLSLVGVAERCTAIDTEPVWDR